MIKTWLGGRAESNQETTLQLIPRKNEGVLNRKDLTPPLCVSSLAFQATGQGGSPTEVEAVLGVHSLRFFASMHIYNIDTYMCV